MTLNGISKFKIQPTCVLNPRMYVVSGIVAAGAMAVYLKRGPISAGRRSDSSAQRIYRCSMTSRS